MNTCENCEFLIENKIFTKWGPHTECLCKKRPIESEEFKSIVGSDYYCTDITHRDCINNQNRSFKEV